MEGSKQKKKKKIIGLVYLAGQPVEIVTQIKVEQTYLVPLKLGLKKIEHLKMAILARGSRFFSATTKFTPK